MTTLGSSTNPGSCKRIISFITWRSCPISRIMVYLWLITSLVTWIQQFSRIGYITSLKFWRRRRRDLHRGSYFCVQSITFKQVHHHSDGWSAPPTSLLIHPVSNALAQRQHGLDSPRSNWIQKFWECAAMTVFMPDCVSSIKRRILAQIARMLPVIYFGNLPMR